MTTSLKNNVYLITLTAALWLPVAQQAEDDIDILDIDLEELELDPVVEEAAAEPSEASKPTAPEPSPPPAAPTAPKPEPAIIPLVPLDIPEVVSPAAEPALLAPADPSSDADTTTGNSPLIRLLENKNAELENALAEIEGLKKELSEVKAALNARSGKSWQSAGAPVIADKSLPNRAVTLYNEAVAHHEAGEHGKAELKYLTVLEYEPTDGPTLYNLGILYDNALKRSKEAYKYYSLFLLHHRNSPEATQVYSWKKALSN